MTVTKPAYFVVLVDCSHSMNHRLAGTTVSKKQAVADTVNGLLFQLFRTSRKADGYRHYFDVSVLGYGRGPMGVDVQPLLDQERIGSPTSTRPGSGSPRSPRRRPRTTAPSR